MRSIRSLAWKPLKMAIRIQDFGMLHVAPDLSGVIPLNAFEAQAAGVRDLAAGCIAAMERGRSGIWRRA